jgi:hypothetical protein
VNKNTQLVKKFSNPEGSLPCSQKPTTGLYPEPDASSPDLPTLFLYNPFCITFPSMPESSQWPLPLRLSGQNIVKHFLSPICTQNTATPLFHPDNQLLQSLWCCIMKSEMKLYHHSTYFVNSTSKGACNFISTVQLQEFKDLL